jgi:prepilin-type N-terminal cleavage/methylation domain-containing protein
MHRCKLSNYRNGFTLVELLIVILLVSLIYFIGFSSIKLDKKKPKALTPLNLKQSISLSTNKREKTTLMCIDSCKTCLLRPSLIAPYQPYSSKINLSNITAYTIDSQNMLNEINYARYKDKRVCLKMNFYPNGSSTQIILKNDFGTYFLPAYFDNPKRFDSLEDAKEYWLKNTMLVSDNGDFY